MDGFSIVAVNKIYDGKLDLTVEREWGDHKFTYNVVGLQIADLQSNIETFTMNLRVDSHPNDTLHFRGRKTCDVSCVLDYFSIEN